MWSLALLVTTILAPAWAQTPANTERAQERSQTQTDNVYRWIKFFAEQPNKAAAKKPRTKTDAATPGQGPATAQVSESVPAKPVPESTGIAVAAPEAPASASASLNAAVLPKPDDADESETTAQSDPPLVPVAVVEPSIPREMRNDAIDARVQLSFTVQQDGTVASPSITSGNNRRLNKAAIDAIKQWRFKPIQGERLTQIEFVFKVE